MLNNDWLIDWLVKKRKELMLNSEKTDGRWQDEGEYGKKATRLLKHYYYCTTVVLLLAVVVLLTTWLINLFIYLLVYLSRTGMSCGLATEINICAWQLIMNEVEIFWIITYLRYLITSSISI